MRGIFADWARAQAVMPRKVTPIQLKTALRFTTGPFLETELQRFYAHAERVDHENLAPNRSTVPADESSPAERHMSTTTCARAAGAATRAASANRRKSAA